MRKLAVAFLILVGAVLSVPGSLQLWEHRVLLNEDAFVSTVNDVFDNETVQQLLARRLTDELMERRQLEERIGEALGNLEARSDPDSALDLQLLTVPVAAALEEAVFGLVLQALEAQPLQPVREQALRVLHRTAKAIVQSDQAYLDREGEALVLDVEAIVEDVLDDLGLERLEEGLSSAELESGGQITLLEEGKFSRVWTLVNGLSQTSPWVAVASAIAFALAIVVSANRRSTTVIAGTAIAVIALAAVVIVSQPLREVTTKTLSEPAGEPAAKATYDIMVKSYSQQQAFVVLVGAVMIAGGILAKEAGRGIKPSVDSEGRRRRGFVTWVRERELLLRFLILGIAAAALVLWPEPSTRLVATVLALAVLCLVAVAIVASESEGAARIRAFVATTLRGPSQGKDQVSATGPLGFVATRAAWFRAGGLLVGVIALVAWPSVSLGVFIFVIALVFLYLAAIDLAVNAARQDDPATQ